MGRESIYLPRFAVWPAAAMLVLCALLALVPAPAAAQGGFAPGSVCHISVEASVSYDEAAKDPSKWTCKGAEFDWSAERHIIRHDLTNAASDKPDPRFAEFDRNAFERIEARVEGENGNVVKREFGFSDLKLGPSSLRGMVPLPDPGSRVTSVVIVHEGGYFPESFVTATLTDKATVPPLAGTLHILAAILCGLLLAPVIFDLAFFRALREPFPLFHAVFCLMAVVQTAAVSGLLPILVTLDFNTELDITYLSLDVMIAATFLFAYFFIEQGRLPRRFRRWLLVLPALTLVNGVATTFFIESFGLWVDHVYFGVLAVIFAGYFYILQQARSHGSRMAPYLMLGIAPLVFIMLLQTAFIYAGYVNTPFDETWPQNFALLFEVVATALAVAERFIAIRRERDTALNAARDLELLSEHDELTGLRNRRALDAQYPSLLREGFRAMAVIDLDHFKSINDIHGHPVGDRVIRSTAWALSPGDDPDLAAFRIGGEEFLMLLRGDDAEAKAEDRRLAVTNRIMAGVEEVGYPVSASMGFVDFSDLPEEADVSFSTLYSIADRLLYEAKVSGRNRTRAEKLDSLPDRREGDRRAAA